MKLAGNEKISTQGKILQEHCFDVREFYHTRSFWGCGRALSICPLQHLPLNLGLATLALAVRNPSAPELGH